MMLKVLPSPVTNEPAVNTPLLMNVTPPIVSEATPSGELMLKPPDCVRLSFGSGSEPSARSSSSTTTSPPFTDGIRLLISGEVLPMAIVRVAVSVSPSPSRRV
ncbi:hypothetical protein D3C75_857900 [compost metagenome]